MARGMTTRKRRTDYKSFNGRFVKRYKFITAPINKICSANTERPNESTTPAFRGADSRPVATSGRVRANCATRVGWKAKVFASFPRRFRTALRSIFRNRIDGTPCNNGLQGSVFQVGD